MMGRNKRKRLNSVRSDRNVRQRISEQREVKSRLEETADVLHSEMHSESIPQIQSENRDCPHCGTHFVSPEAYRYHKQTKTQNQNSRSIPAKDFKKNVHHVLCPELNCCYSNKDPKLVKIHSLRMHQKPLGGMYTVISNLTVEEEKVTSHPCGICCKNYSSALALSNHRRTCKGKFLFSCTYCTEKFQDRKEFIQHLNENHKPSTDFQQTAVFVGDSSSKVKTNKLGIPKASERSLVILQPHITTTDEIFNPQVCSELRKLMEWDLALGKRFSARLLCRSIIQKQDEGDIITKEFISQTPTIICGSSKNIENAIDQFIAATNRNLGNLHATPSGYSLLEVTSLTLMSSFIPDIRGGCGQYLNEMHKSSERRGLLAIKSNVENDDEVNNMCLKDAILFQVYGKSIMKKLIEKHKPNCKALEHDVACYCYIKAEQEFMELATDQEYWQQLYDDKRINWEGIKFPAGLEDISLFSDQNPRIHLRAFLIYGSTAVNVFVGPRTSDQVHFVDICFSEFHSYNTHEIMGHWYPVKNLCEFTSQILRKKDGSNHVHKRYGEAACEKCLEHHFLVKPETVVNRDGIDPNDKLRGLYIYRNKYCPYELPENMILSETHSQHLKICGVENETLYRAKELPSMISLPKSSFFLFQNYRQTIKDRFSGFFDLETFNEPLEPTCVACELLMNTTSSRSEKDRIYTECINEHHFRQNCFKCHACLSQFRTALISRECIHPCEDEVQEKVLGNCLECFIDEEKKFSDCNHQKTQNIRKLEASGFSFLLHDNYKNQVVLTKNYFQESEQDDDPLDYFMKYLQTEVTDLVQTELEKEAPMVITEEEEEAFQNADHCYTCHKKFRSNDKLRDHCHVLGKYRGAACRSCNRALTIRNEVSIWAHNLTNFDGHMVLRSLGRGWDNYKVIPRNSEKVTGITMSKKLKPLPTAMDLIEENSDKPVKDKYLKFTFKDSMSFLQASLEANTEKLRDSNHSFPYLRNSEFCKTNGKFDEEKLQLLIRKAQ